MNAPDRHTRNILAGYFDIAPEQQDVLSEQLESCPLRGGEWLFRQGDPGDSFYLLIRGRLQVWLEADESGPLLPAKLIGRVTPGDSVGEIGLLTGASRTAGVRAIRDSQLIRISRSAFDDLAQRHPALVMRLAGRAAALVHQPSTLDSGATRNLNAIALLPLNNSEQTVHFCRELCEQLQVLGTTRVLSIESLAHSTAPVRMVHENEVVPESLVHWVEQQEDESRLLIFQCQAQDSEWTRFSLRQSDLVILVGEHQDAAAVRPWEQRLGIGDQDSNLRRALVLLQGRAGEPIINTAAWYRGRVLDFHLHVRSGTMQDVGRVARVLMGQAVGLVLGAGASRGFAHLGVFRALREAAMPIDWIGGTSIGAIMGAMMAFDWTPEQCISTGRSSFVKGKPFSDYTLPLVSLLAGRRMKRLIRSQANMNIEDMPLPFFCISSSLNDGNSILHQMGSLARALEATASMPGILPPTVVGQALAIDGSVLNSLPVDVMWQQPVGKVIASDLATQKTRTVDYAEIPSAWTLLRSRLLPLGRKYRVPGLMALLLKSTELATLQQVRAQGARASVLLQPDVHHFGLTEVKAFDRIVDAGYQYTRGKIVSWSKPG